MTDYEKEFGEKIYSVSDVNGYVKELVEGIPVFSGIRIRGEISNFVRHRSGHLYFSLKDDRSVIRAVMFMRDAARLSFEPGDGLKVVAKGRLTVYHAGGYYQITVSSLEADGRGALYEAYERLKNRLEEEGLFSDKYKKPFPRFPLKIGVITSPTGAAVRDIINITGRRWPLAEILLYPALVQGEGAEDSLISGVEYFTRTKKAELVIIGRGGGSIEDLWAFNSERLARAIAASEIPFISAVGHETDFTICDFVSSRRAPTPSGAAELAVPDMSEVKYKFDGYLSKIRRETESLIQAGKNRLSGISDRKVLRSPYGFIDERRQKLDILEDSLVAKSKLKLSGCRADYEKLCAKLNALSPLSVLTRGYGAVYSEKGEVITSVKKINTGEEIRVLLSDGKIEARAERISERNVIPEGIGK